MLNDSTQNEKKKSDFFSLDFLIKIELTIHDKEIAIKNFVIVPSLSKLSYKYNCDFEKNNYLFI